MTHDDPHKASERLTNVTDRLARTADLVGRKGDAVTLIAVSKTQSVVAIETLIAAGVRDFGENRVQEMQAKWPDLLARHPDVRLHFIGRLQSNKAAEAVQLCDAIHSLDRRSLVDALAKAIEGNASPPDLFVQVDIGDEPQKGGVAIGDLGDLLGYANSKGLVVSGLMAVPPLDVEPAPYFALLAKLAAEHRLAGLSMGMSGDFETAAMLGSTHVRVGSALFGARD